MVSIRRTLVTTLLMATSVTLAGCGDSSDDDPAAPAPTTTAAPASTTALTTVAPASTAAPTSCCPGFDRGSDDVTPRAGRSSGRGKRLHTGSATCPTDAGSVS